MAKGDKTKYTDKQKRQADHIEKGYEQRGVSEPEAEKRAWATVNKITGGAKKSAASRGKTADKEPTRKGGSKGGASVASRTKAQRSESAKKAAATRKRNASKRVRATAPAKKPTATKRAPRARATRAKA